MQGEKDLTAIVIGPTDRTKLFRFGSIRQEDYDRYLTESATILVQHLQKVDIIPDMGVPLDMARRYKDLGGKEVVGYIPRAGYESLKPNFKFCDKIEKIEGGWTELNTHLSLKSGLAICFGISPGTLVEIAYSKYHLRYLGKKIRILADIRSMSSRLPAELEDELVIDYFDSAKILNELLRKIKSI